MVEEERSPSFLGFFFTPAAVIHQFGDYNKIVKQLVNVQLIMRGRGRGQTRFMQNPELRLAEELSCVARNFLKVQFRMSGRISVSPSNGLLYTVQL